MNWFLYPSTESFFPIIGKKFDPVRYQKLCNLPDVLFLLYMKCHGLNVTTKEVDINILSSTTELPVEKYIDKLALNEDGSYSYEITDYGLNKVITELHMCIPPNMNPLTYVIDNIHYYNTVVVCGLQEQDMVKFKEIKLFSLDFSLILNFMTDWQIMDLCGVIVPYNSRPMLIANAIGFLSGMLVPCLYITERPINQETYLGSKLHEVDTICVGYRGSIRVYEEQEFLMNIQEHKHSRYTIRLPGANYTLDKKFIENLLTLLHTYNKFPELREKLQFILVNTFPETSELKNILYTIKPSAIGDVFKYLQVLFMTGFAMRGWKEGESYPYKEKDTHNSPEPLTTNYLLQLTALYNNMDDDAKFVVDSMMLHYGKDRMTINLVERIDSIINDPDSVYSCIRVNSAMLIETAYIYLYELFNYTIPNFDVNNLEHIE